MRRGHDATHWGAWGVLGAVGRAGRSGARADIAVIGAAQRRKRLSPPGRSLAWEGKEVCGARVNFRWRG